MWPNMWLFQNILWTCYYSCVMRVLLFSSLLIQFQPFSILAVVYQWLQNTVYCIGGGAWPTTTCSLVYMQFPEWVPLILVSYHMSFQFVHSFIHSFVFVLILSWHATAPCHPRDYIRRCVSLRYNNYPFPPYFLFSYAVL